MLRLMALFYEIHAVAGRDNAWVIPVFYSCFTDAFWITLTRGCMFWRDQKNGSFGINNYNCILHQLVLILSPPDPLSIHTFLVWDFFFSILKSCALDPCFFWQMIFGSKKQVFDTCSCMFYFRSHPARPFPLSVAWKNLFILEEDCDGVLLLPLFDRGRLLESTIEITSNQGAYQEWDRVFLLLNLNSEELWDSVVRNTYRPFPDFLEVWGSV